MLLKENKRVVHKGFRHFRRKSVVLQSLPPGWCGYENMADWLDMVLEGACVCHVEQGESHVHVVQAPWPMWPSGLQTSHSGSPGAGPGSHRLHAEFLHLLSGFDVSAEAAHLSAGLSWEGMCQQQASLALSAQK